MRKLVMVVVLAVGSVIPAQAVTAKQPPYNIKPPKPYPVKPPKPYPVKCTPVNEGFEAIGTLITASLTPTSHHRYSGSIEVNVSRANHRAPTGIQTYKLTNAHVIFHHRVNPAAPAAGSRVILSGTITGLPARCSTTGFTPTITVTTVDISQAPKGHHHGRRHH